MIRFVPDSLLEAIARPIAMAVPAGSIYVETIAPDFRFLFALALALAWLAYRVRAHAAAARTLGLLAFCAAAFVPWLATTGNGRYFVAVLLLGGPLCIALLHHLPTARRLRLAGAGLMLAGQVLLLQLVTPWNSWGLSPWQEGGAFPIDVPTELRSQPATYVTVTSISYSLLAPAFHPDSRWISLTSQSGRRADEPDVQRAQRFLRASGKMFLLYPAPPQRQPESGSLTLPGDVREVLDQTLGEHRLHLDVTQPCAVLPSRGLTAMGLRPGESVSHQPQDQRGFWLCPLAQGASTSVTPAPVAVDSAAAMDRVEQLCPRMFPPHGGTTAAIGGLVQRHYVESDMRLYVAPDGTVFYKYMRALNPVILGSKQQLLASGFTMDCNIRGRSGLPWDREI